MTDSENLDLFRGLTAGAETDSPSEPAERSALPSTGFTSRREMRAAGGYAAPAALTATVEPAEPIVTAASAKRTQRMSRSARRAHDRDAVRTAVAQKPVGQGWRRRVSTAGVMTVVVGLFATFTLPAFAEQDTLAETMEPLAGQSLEVTAATSDESQFIRDSYSTTSAAQLRAMYAAALREQNLAAYLASGARELGDDYPWPDALSRPQGGGLSPLNYYYRECVDFVAWRLNRDAGSTKAPFRWVWSNLAQGSAYSWKNAWISRGWDHGTKPRAGAVAWFPGGNHVAYVSGILSDGSVALEEYNYSVDHGYSQRIIQPNQAYYLYAPPS